VEIDIKAELVRLAEPEYAVFSRRLLPGTENVLGVRLPLLRLLSAHWGYICIYLTINPPALNRLDPPSP